MGSHRTRNSKRNLIFGLLSFAVTSVLSFVVRSVFISKLSTELLGIDGLYTSILQILSLGEFGLSNVAMFTLYKPLANGDNKKVAQLIKFYSKIFWFIAGAIFVVGLAVIPFLGNIVNGDIGINMGELILYYLIYLLSVSISYIGISKQLLINADQKAYIIRNTTTVLTVLKSIGQILILIFTSNYVFYLLLQCVYAALFNLHLFFRARKLYPAIKNTNEQLPSAEKRNILNMTKDLFVYKVCVVVINSTDNIFISTLIGTMMVGLYSNYAMIFTALTSIFNVVVYSISSSLGNLVAKEKKEKKISFFYDLLTIMQLATSVVAICLLALTNDFVRLWIGDGFVLGVDVLIVLVVNFYVCNVINPVWMYREAMGLYREVKYVMVATAALNIIFTYVLGTLMGLPGIFLATVISRLLTTVWYEPKILLKKHLKTNLTKYYSSQLKNTILTVAIGTIIYSVSSIVVPGNVLQLVIKCFVVFVVSTIPFIVLNINNKRIREILAKTKRVFKGNK